MQVVGRNDMNKRTAATLLVIGIVALVGVLVWGIWGSFSWDVGSVTTYGTADTEVYSEDVPASEIQNVDVALVAQDLQITAVPGDTIHIVQYGPSGGIEDRFRVQTSTSGDTLRISVQSASGGFMFFGWNSEPYTRVEITMPPDLAGSLSAASISGSVGVDGLTADRIEVDSTSGDVDLRSSKCNELDAGTTSGGVRLDNVQTGDLHASSVSGGISVDDTSSAETVEMSTISGDIRCRLDKLREFNASTTSGGVQFSIEDAAGLRRINAETVSGSVDIQVPAGTEVNTDFTSISGSSHIAQDGSGAVIVSGSGIPVSVSTTSGDLRLSAI